MTGSSAFIRAEAAAMAVFVALEMERTEVQLRKDVGDLRVLADFLGMSIKEFQLKLRNVAAIFWIEKNADSFRRTHKFPN